VLVALREYTKALEALDVAREQDEAAGSKSAREIQELSFKIQSSISAQRANETEQETMERAMRDPEVAVRHRPGSPLIPLCARLRLRLLLLLLLLTGGFFLVDG